MAKRGRAGRDKQLGALQVRILLWLRDGLHGTALDPLWSRVARLVKQERRKDPSLAEIPLKPINEKGVRWNVKRFYDDPEPSRSQEAALSEARARLEARSLIKCAKSGGQTTHAKLTKLGWETANHWREYGVSERELERTTPETPEGARYAKLKGDIGDRLGRLRHARRRGDAEGATKLSAEIAALEAELVSLEPKVERSRAEALVAQYPDTPAAARLREHLELPDFYEAVSELNAKPERKELP